MTHRKRTTWGKEAGQDKAASPPPAMPGYLDADGKHPADQGDPAYDQYAKGDTSAWAEDPHPGPYPNSAPPADPRDDGTHPAEKRASDDEPSPTVLQKAAKCARIASAMLGPQATEAQVENQALDFMHMPDAAIDASLSRLAEDDEEDEEESEDSEDNGNGDEDGDKEASAEDAEDRQILAELEAELEGESKFAELEGQIADLQGQLAKLSDQNESDDTYLGQPDTPEAIEAEAVEVAEEGVQASGDKEAEEMLQEMLAQEEGGDEDAEAEAMLLSMLNEEAPVEGMLDDADQEVIVEGLMGGDEPEAEVVEEVAVEAQIPEPMLDEADMMDAEMDVDMMVDDPMGLMDDDAPMVETDLMSLYAKKKGGDKEEESDEKKKKDEEEGEEEAAETVQEEVEEEAKDKDAEKESKKKKAAAAAPQPKKASTGVKTLGGMSRTAAAEVNELEKLWETAPDVSDVFNQ